jgi:hypothetical protein
MSIFPFSSTVVIGLQRFLGADEIVEKLSTLTWIAWGSLGLLPLNHLYGCRKTVLFLLSPLLHHSVVLRQGSEHQSFAVLVA